MKSRITPPCTACGKRMKIGNTNGMPNMVGFVLEDGTTINVCQECMIKLGKMTDAEKSVFLAELQKKAGEINSRP